MGFRKTVFALLTFGTVLMSGVPARAQYHRHYHHHYYRHHHRHCWYQHHHRVCRY